MSLIKMNLFIWIAFLGSLHASLAVKSPDYKLFCYVDSQSFSREGLSQFSISDLEVAAPNCSHLVYGYMGIRGKTYEAFSLNPAIDIEQHQLTAVTSLKRKFPHLKVLLSVGGDRDIDNEHPNKYIELLEGGRLPKVNFIQSVYSLIKDHGFDGIDLAYQFPRNKPKKVHSGTGSAWKSIKKLFSGDFIVDEHADEHKAQFTSLVGDLRNTLSKDGLLVMLTVLPNVNSTWYFDVPALDKLVDYVNLAAFDFVTPHRNPEEADFTAPYSHLENRLSHYNVKYQQNYWIDHGFTSAKLITGIPTYGNAWKLTSDSGSDGKPIVPHTAGPAPGGFHSKTPGLLSFPEICLMLPNQSKDSALKQSPGLEPFYGTYAYRDSDTDGIWVSYEDEKTVREKTIAARYIHGGGVSVIDLSHDDFRGLCTGAKYPLLGSINENLIPLDSYVRPRH